MKIFFASSLMLLASQPVAAHEHEGVSYVSLGPRPFWLLRQMRDNSVKSTLETCAMETKVYRPSDFSIGHRGACMQFPEHTLESYEAAATMGAGIIECDVTFTSDRQLVCRHAQCDLHTTTNVVAIPELNAKCTTPFVENDDTVTPVCCTSDFTLEEIKTLCAKMDAAGSLGGTAEEYVYGGTAAWRTDLHQYECSKVPTHKESIELIKSKGGKYTPELKTPSVDMPFDSDYTQEDYAQQMIDEYTEAGIPPEKVWPQSFLHSDVYYWVNNTDFGDQAVALDDNYESTPEEFEAMFDELTSRGVKIVAPPMQRLVEADTSVELLMKKSAYATAAKERGLDIITWTLERTGPGLQGFYWSTTQDINVCETDSAVQTQQGGDCAGLREGDKFNLLHVLAFDVGVLGVFSDWPATTTFFANCYNLTLLGDSEQCLTDAEINQLETEAAEAASAASSLAMSPIVGVAGLLSLTGLFMM